MARAVDGPVKVQGWCPEKKKKKGKKGKDEQARKKEGEVMSVRNGHTDRKSHGRKESREVVWV